MKLLGSGALVAAANLTDIGATLLRNVILARLLTVSDFGVTATFTILMTLIDVGLSSGLNNMVVQARDVNDPVLQRTLHAVQLSLGGIMSLILLLAAWPYAALMGTPQHAWAYALMALVPLMRSMVNNDSYRLQRHGRFAPSMIRQMIPPLVGVLAIYPAYLWLGDYRVVIVTIYVQNLALLLATHYGAERRYALGFDRAIARRAFAFGWPLFLNSLLIYFVINGDRMVVSNQFGIETLGWFSAAVMLTLMPMNFVAKTVQTLILPSMARHQDDAVRLQRQYDLSISLVAAVGVGFAAAIALLGGPILALLFGQKFMPALPYLLLLGIMQGIRLFRAAPALAALSRAETKNPLLANIVRGLFIPLSLLVAIKTRDIHWMILVGIVGEIVAASFSALLAQRLVALSSRHFQLVLAAAALAFAVIGGVSLLAWPWWLLLPAAAIFLWSIRDFLFHFKEAIRR